MDRRELEIESVQYFCRAQYSNGPTLFEENRSFWWCCVRISFYDIVAKSWISIVFSRPDRFWDNRIEKTSQSLCKWILVEFVIQSESSRKRGCFRILSISNIRIKLNITWTNCFWILFCIIILVALSQGTLIRHEW